MMATNILRHLLCGLADIIPVKQNSEKHHREKTNIDIYTGEQSSTMVLPSCTEAEQIGVITPSRNSSLIKRCKLHRHGSTPHAPQHHSLYSHPHLRRAHSHPTKRVKSLTRSDINFKTSSETTPERESSHTVREPRSQLTEIEDSESVAPFQPEPPLHIVDSDLDRSFTNVSSVTNESNFLHFVIDNTPNYSYGITNNL